MDIEESITEDGYVCYTDRTDCSSYDYGAVFTGYSDEGLFDYVDEIEDDFSVYRNCYWSLEGKEIPSDYDFPLWAEKAMKDLAISRDVMYAYIGNPQILCPWLVGYEPGLTISAQYPNAILLVNSSGVTKSISGRSIWYSYLAYEYGKFQSVISVEDNELVAFISRLDSLYGTKPYSRDILHVWYTVFNADLRMGKVRKRWTNALYNRRIAPSVVHIPKSDENLAKYVASAILALEADENVEFPEGPTLGFSSSSREVKYSDENLASGDWYYGKPVHVHGLAYYVPYTDNYLVHRLDGAPRLTHECFVNLSSMKERLWDGPYCTSYACAYSDKYFAATEKGVALRKRADKYHGHPKSREFTYSMCVAGERKIKRAIEKILFAPNTIEFQGVYDRNYILNFLGRNVSQYSIKGDNMMIRMGTGYPTLPKKGYTRYRYVADKEIPVSITAIQARCGLRRSFVEYVVERSSTLRFAGCGFIISTIEGQDITKSNILDHIGKGAHTVRAIAVRSGNLNRRLIIAQVLNDLIRDGKVARRKEQDGRVVYVLVPNADVTARMYRDVLVTLEAEGELHIGALAKMLKIQAFKLEKYMRVLEKDGVVKRRVDRPVWMLCRRQPPPRNRKKFGIPYKQ